MTAESKRSARRTASGNWNPDWESFALGATREEITAVLQLTSLAGLSSMFVGAPILLEELDASAQSGE